MDRPNLDAARPEPRKGAVQCYFCREWLPNMDSAYEKVEGWVARRHAGGTNAIRLKTSQRLWSCRWCIDKQARGLNHNQGSLL